MAYTDRFIEMYREVSKGGQLSEAEVLALGQPPAPGLRIYKVFKFLAQRIERVEQPTQAMIDEAVEKRVEAIRAELQAQFNRLVFRAQRRGIVVSE